METSLEKRELRRRVWYLLKERGVALPPFPIEGRIPNFKGAREAAERLRKLELWKRARVVLVNPDSAQRYVRELALRDGKLLVVASPKLRTGYLLLDPKSLRGREKEASTIRGAFKFGKRIGLDVLSQRGMSIDLVVEGSVAVDLDGNRLGKGGGYGDREIAEVRKFFRDVVVVTLVHDLQVVERVPTTEFDQKVDLIVTPTRIVRCRKGI